MDYAIYILKLNLNREKSYYHQHQALYNKNSITEKRTYEMRTRLAEKRIPSLEAALQRLRYKPKKNKPIYYWDMKNKLGEVEEVTE